MLIDRFGNIFIAARKATSNLFLASDDRSPTATRSMSWLWTSSDGGKTFANMHGYPLDAENHMWGYEGDISLDDAGHLYFVDQSYADSTIARWTINGLGDFAFDFHRPLLPTSQPVDDRPWLASHGDGNVFEIVNSGDAALNPLGRDGGDAYGPGRFSIYRSTDGGRTFEPMGHSLKQSGGCRPAADHRAGSKLVYVACTNDGGVEGPIDEPHGRGTLWAYVSADDGATHGRYRIGDYNADAETFDWPLVAVGPNGDVWVLHVDAGEVEQADDGFQIITNRLLLYHSSDHGRTWSRQDVTPATGRYRWGWLTVSPKGDLAFAIQHRPNATAPWRAYAAVFTPGAMPALVSIDEANPIDGAESAEPPSEIMGVAFAPGERLAVAWTRIETVQGLRFRRVLFATALPNVSAPRPKVAGVKQTRRLPATGVARPGTTGFVALVASGIVAWWLTAANLRRYRFRHGR